MTAAEGDNDSGMQRFELYIKASGIDRETKGADPICQQFFMITCLMGEFQDDVDFKVFTVQADCPPKNFAKGWSKKYPVIMVNEGRNKSGKDISGMMYDTFEELEVFFEGINKDCPELKRKNAPNIAALAVVENFYKYFNHFIAGKADKAMVGELRKLNEYLEGQETKFLVDNVLSFADCHLLPRLQHLRVASKAYRQFDIPKEFIYIWRYLRNAYEQDAFRSTMPSDQDIIMFYEKKAPGGLPKDGKFRWHRISLENFTYTMEIPDDIQDSLKTLAPQSPAAATQEPQPSPPAPQSPTTNGGQQQDAGLPAGFDFTTLTESTPSTEDTTATTDPADVPDMAPADDLPPASDDAQTTLEPDNTSNTEAVVDPVVPASDDSLASNDTTTAVPEEATVVSTDASEGASEAVSSDCGQLDIASLPADLSQQATINGTS